MGMKTISTTIARKNIKTLIDLVRETGDIIAIGRHNVPEAILIGYPQNYNKKLNDITNVNANSESFVFLKDEPDIYSHEDLKKVYA